MGVTYRKNQRTVSGAATLLVRAFANTLGAAVFVGPHDGDVAKFVVSSVDEGSAAKRAWLKAGDICESYYKDRTDDNDADEPWSSDTIKYLEHIAVLRTDVRGAASRRCCAIVIGNNNKTSPRRTKFCHENKRDANFEKRLQAFEGFKLKRAVAADDAPKRKKAKISADSDDEEPEEEAEITNRKTPMRMQKRKQPSKRYVIA